MGATAIRVPAVRVIAGLVRACVVLASVASASLAYADVPTAAAASTNTPGSNPVTTDATGAPTTFGGTNDTVAGTRSNFFTYGADVGVGYSDNITETATDKRSDEMLGVGVQVSGLDQNARFQGAVLGDLEHVNYLQGTFSPQIIGNFAGYASYALVPDFLHWMAQESLGEGLVDPFASESPGNLENINTITTGPSLTLPLDALTLLTVSARYSRVSYQVSPLDNNDYGGSLALTRLLSARSRISFNVQSERYEYTDPINPSYDQREAFLRYDIQGARTHIAFDAGYDQIRGHQLDSSGLLARISASRTIAPGSVLSISAGREPSNSAAFVGQSQSVSGIGLQTTPGLQTAIPFTNEYETLGWSFNRRRTTLNITLTHYQQIFQGQSVLDQAITSADVRVSRILYPGWIASLYVDYSKQSFAQQTGGYHQEHGGMNLKWQMARKLALTFEYDRYDRNSSLALYSFAENRVWVRLQYGTGMPNSSLGGSSSDSSVMSVAKPDPFTIPMPSH
jgi:hypothetical protein